MPFSFFGICLVCDKITTILAFCALTSHPDLQSTDLCLHQTRACRALFQPSRKAEELSLDITFFSPMKSLKSKLQLLSLILSAYLF